MKINTEKNIRVAIYARVANGEQIDIDRKVGVCLEYAKRISNHSIVAKYTDLNKSGRIAIDRDGFQKMLLDAEKGIFDLIVACDLYDFSRTATEALYYLQKLKQINIDVCFIGGRINTDDPNAELSLTLMAALQQDESRRQSQRIKYGQMMSRANGTIFGTGNVLGYDKVDGNYVINPAQAEIVRMIFSQFIDGVGIRKICNNLEENGKRTSTGKSIWRPTTVARILKNPVYCGKVFYPRSNEIVDGTHEPIITLEDFERVQQILKERSKKYRE